MIFNINSTRGQTRFLTCVARVTCLVKYYKKEENNNFQCQLSRFYFHSIWKKINISVTRVTLPYQLMFEIFPLENKLDNIFLYYSIEYKDINDRY